LKLDGERSLRSAVRGVNPSGEALIGWAEAHPVTEALREAGCELEVQGAVGPGFQLAKLTARFDHRLDLVDPTPEEALALVREQQERREQENAEQLKRRAAANEAARRAARQERQFGVRLD
jgi:hypothetical protein